MEPAQTGIAVFPAGQRFHTRIGWLDSWHSFSFGEHYDPRRLGIDPLRVLNDDVVAPGQGFGAHPHRDMEIVSYVLSGALAHEDSGGHRGVVRAGEAQFMRAGTGVVHAEMNASATEPVRFLQVWLRPRRRGLAPVHEHRAIHAPPDGAWRPIAGDGGFGVDADAALLAARVAPAGRAVAPVPARRQGYLFLAEGDARLAGRPMAAGDAALLPPGEHELRTDAGAHALLFDLPG